MWTRAKVALVCAGFLLAVWALGRAAFSQYRQRMNSIYDGCKADLTKTGLSKQAALNKYFTPEIHLISGGALAPGSTGEIVVKGRFVEGSKLTIENDEIQTVSDKLVNGDHHLTVSVAAGAMPGNFGLVAIAPVSCASTQANGVVIGGRYEWSLVASNGWRIVLTSVAPSSDSDEGPGAPMQYKAAFMRPGESAPFKSLTAEYGWNMYDKVANFTPQQDASSAMGGLDMAALSKKMTDPNLSEAEREKVMQQMQEAVQQIQKNAQKMSDPNNMRQMQAQQQAEERAFGCKTLSLKMTGSQAAGSVHCGASVGDLTLNGSVKYLGK